MKKLLALLRGISTLIIIFTGAPIAVALSIFPIKIRGIQLGHWLPHLMSRGIIRVLNINVICENRERIADHNGFLFPTHDTWLDIFVMTALVPTRYVAAIEVKRIPMFRLMGWALEAVWVDRDKKTSRMAVRTQLDGANLRPPVVIFPEGKLDTTPELAPFRHGAFEIAIRNNASILPVALHYPDYYNVRWLKEESITDAFLRMAETWSTDVYVSPMGVVQTANDDVAAELASDAEEQILTRLHTYIADPKTAIIGEKKNIGA